MSRDDRDEYRPRFRDEPDPPEAPPNVPATVAFVLGVLSLVFGPLTGLPGVVAGIVAVTRPHRRRLAALGLATSATVTVVSSALWVFGGLAIRDGIAKRKELADRMATSNRFKQVVLAAHTYHDVNNGLPTPYASPGWGNPPDVSAIKLEDRLSWRVSILPYLEQGNISNRMNVNEAWNSPANLPWSNQPVPAYADLDTPADPDTRVRCFYDNGAAFDTRTRTRLIDITDGTTNTILYVQGGQKVTWSRFGEYKFDPARPLPALGKPDADGFWVVMGDAQVKWVKKTVDEKVLKAAITKSGGETVTLP